MLREDLKTVRGIVARKREVGAHLRESAAWCHPGLWLVEGPYARHKDAVLPDSLKDAIRGIRSRRASREIVERAAPPWVVNVPALDVQDAPTANCSIAYLSNGGNWKLFDFEGQKIWTRIHHVERLERDRTLHQQFSTFFNIPAWQTLTLDDGVWRSETYIADSTYVHCDTATRSDVFRALLKQYRLLAQHDSRPPAPSLTRAALATIKDCAPDTLPARIARSHASELQHLGECLRLAPSHGDFGAQNIFVCDGQPWIIDWDTAGQYEPLLTDLHYLAVREAELDRSDLFEALLGGRFDSEIALLLASCEIPACLRDNLLLILHSYIVHFHAAHLAGRRDATRQNVTALWNRLNSYCSMLS